MIRLRGSVTDLDWVFELRFSDQGNKRRYQRDEDRLFKEAVSALKTADQLYPDSSSGGELFLSTDFPLV